MAQPQDIDEILLDWPYQPGTINARLVHAADGREVLQMRIEMGLLQMESINRPDGHRPGGSETYLDYLIGQSLHKDNPRRLSEEECIEVDREFMQYYHRRICWLALREFRRAIKDADHTLNLMDLVASRSPEDQWTASHEQYRSFVLFHRTQAAALAELQESGPDKAIQKVDEGLARLRAVLEAQGIPESFDEDEMVAQLRELKGWVREQYQVERTLTEQLADAVAAEEYELAAKLRDEIALRQSKHV